MIELENFCDNCAFTSMGYGVTQDGKLEMDLNWKEMYGELVSGDIEL